MYRDGVPGERVDGEHIKILRGLGFQRQSCIAHDYINFRGRVAQIAEKVFGDARNLWVDFVEAEVVADCTVSGQRAGTETNCAHALAPLQQCVSARPTPESGP